MYQLATFNDLYQQHHTLGLYCINCDRWASVDLSALIDNGQGRRVITKTRFRCSECGLTAEKQVRPPVPEVGGAVAYIQHA